jgi:signal transduction histidine kinase
MPGLPAFAQETVARGVRRWLFVPVVLAPTLLPARSARTRPLPPTDEKLDQSALAPGWSLGVLAVGRAAQAPGFGEQDVRLLTLLAEQIAQALVQCDLAGRLAQTRHIGQQAEEALAEAAQLERVLEDISEGVLLVAADGQIVRLNCSGRQLLDWPADQQASPARPLYLQDFAQTQWSHANGDALPHEQWPMLRALGGEHFQQLVVRYGIAGGQDRLLIFNGRPLYDTQGRVEAALLNFHLAGEEQGQRAHLELAAYQATQRTRYVLAVLEAMTDGLLVCDRQGLLFLVNAAGQTLLGVETAAPCALPAFLEALCVRRPSGEAVLAPDFPLGRALLGETVRDVDLVFWRPSTQSEWYARVSAVPIWERAEDGAIAGALCVLVDRTEARALEEERNEFLTVVAHDLKGPLTSIHGFAQMLLRGARRAPQERERRADMQWVEKIEGQTERMTRMVEELSDAAQADMGQLQLRRRPVALGALLRRVAEAQQVTSERHKMVLEVPALLLFAQGDEVRLEQVFTNLVANAIKYSPAGGEITITVVVVEGGQYRHPGSAAASGGLPQPYIEVRVSDQGQGIAPGDVERIFRRFTRSEAAVRSKTQGLGLGLYIARAILHAHGGTISAESPGVGEGSTFLVRLPRLERPAGR